MRLQQTLTRLATLLGAIDSVSPETRDVVSYDYRDLSGQATLLQFVDVPITYDIRDIDHACHVGMYWKFSNDETWLTLDGKRLFLTPLVGDDTHHPAGSEIMEDWPVMGPEELHETLKKREPYEETSAKWQAVLDKVSPGHAFSPEYVWFVSE